MLPRTCLFSMLLFVVCVLSGNAFRPTPRLLTRTNPMPLKAVDPNLLLLANAADGYGQVNAPAWALPAGALFVILLAGIPALLAPGEKALEEQRRTEAEKGNAFGSGDSVSRKKKDL